MPGQFFLEDPAGLNEETAINRFVRNPHVGVRWKLALQPSGNLFGRPISSQLVGHEPSQTGLISKSTPFGPARLLPG
jgi:hypothetical protein